MGRAVVNDCLPWLALWLTSCAGMWLLVRVNRGRLRFRRLLGLHRDEVGSAQSLSFVLTLPLFVLVLLFIVQVSQLMIGIMMVHYAAFAAARAAIVWIPARMGNSIDPSSSVAENCVEQYIPDPGTLDQVPPNDDDRDVASFHPTSGGMTYRITRLGPKEAKILGAAWMACLPICPSRNVWRAGSSPSVNPQMLASLQSAYHSLAPASSGAAPEKAIDRRLQNKLAYAAATTFLDVKFYHGNEENLEAPLTRRGGFDPTAPTWDLSYNPEMPRDRSPSENELGRYEFRASDVTGYHEIGYQDPITVKVTHYFALMPGVGRFLATHNEPPPGSSEDLTRTAILQKTQEGVAKSAQTGMGLPQGVYLRRIEATCTLGNEGDKSVMAYAYSVN
jgi:hypothetical protein